jgi:hypothetical protein
MQNIDSEVTFCSYSIDLTGGIVDGVADYYVKLPPS